LQKTHLPLKITREIKTAILVIASILLFIWGYSFLKGRDLFVDYKTYYVKYDNVLGLVNSAPVTINGMVVGKVSSIKQNQDWTSTVELQVKSDYPITKGSLAELFSSSPIAGKEVSIIPNLKDTTPADDKSFLASSNKLGLTEVVSEEIKPIKDKLNKVLENANLMLENINQVLDAKTKENLKASLQNLNETLVQFKEVSRNANQLLASNQQKIGNTMTNVEKASANFSKVSDSIAKVNIGGTVKKLESTLANVDKLMADIQSGKGTLGKLTKDETLYNNFAKTSKELELLLQDLRLNPTRYVNVSLFGKKNKPYKAPVNDTIKK
jgi:phospholipid/cholesterol/gamma-HCH transport system substrate-binding protein